METLHISHILAPLDFSKSSLNALDTAAAMAERHDAKLTLLYVIDTNVLSHGHFDTFPPAPSPILETLFEESENILGQIADKIKSETTREVSIKTTYGLISSEICKTARDIEADLVVMGCRGSSAFRFFFMGSNAYSVVKFAPCPVLTIPSTGEWRSFSKILFPVRDTPGALQKYDFLRKIIRPNKSVLHIIGLPNKGSASSWDWVYEKVQKIKNRLRDDHVSSHTQLLISGGRIAEQVLKVAETEKIDLIAITATLDHGIQEFFIGPYTRQIINHAQVPVLCIRPVTPGLNKRI